MTRRDPMDGALCGWGRCMEPTDGPPLCERHLRKAWSIIQARLNDEQRATASRGET